jgi:competence ComEA-like helix-hairpin-helix protein
VWGREMRAGLLFVLVSLAVGSVFREWRRGHTERFADLIERLERGSLSAEATSPLSPAPRDSLSASPADDRGPAAAGMERTTRRRAPPAFPLRPAAIDVDRASASELMRLPGIGPALAARIVADRASRGPFGSPEALRRVPGIGPRILGRIRPFLADSAPPDSGAPNAN